MQYCFDKKQLKCLFATCCDFPEYQKENFIINFLFLVVLVIVGTGLCGYIFYSKRNKYSECYFDNKKKNNNNNNNNEVSNTTTKFKLFGKNLSANQTNLLRSNREYLSDKFNLFAYVSNITVIFFNIFTLFLLFGKFMEIINIYNEFKYPASIIDNSISNDKDILRDESTLPVKMLDIVFKIFVIIVNYTVFNIDSEFLDNNKKNISTMIFAIYYCYASLNVYFEKKILLYENYLFYAVVSLLIVLLVFVFSIFQNKVFFSKLSKLKNK